MENEITIESKQYRLLEVLESVPVVDSFVKTNKLKSIRGADKTPGHGEGRLYIGSQKEADKFNTFFDNYEHSVNCFFLKSDFDSYLKDAEYEYMNKAQSYNLDISQYYTENVSEVNALPTEILPFQIETANGVKDKARYYIRSTQPKKNVWLLFRKITLPRITYVSILKLQDKDKIISFYFKAFLDYEFNSINHPAKIKKVEQEIKNSSIPEKTKNILYLARKGQGQYREKLIEKMLYCPFTQVTDERVLIASHIKPWSIADEKEQKDPSNGILFTPTYDRLFDQGFISFEDNGSLLLSPYLSPLNRKRLGLTAGKIIDIKPLGKEKYLQYHRDKIFKK